MVQIINVNGGPASGKSTFEVFCLAELGAYGDQISTVDFVKDVAKYCGWNGSKTPQNRAFLSDLKDLLTKWDDVPWKKIMARRRAIESQLSELDMTDKVIYLFVDSREPWELQRFREEANAISVLIRRPSGGETEISNHADAEVEEFNYDYIIENDAGLEELKILAKSFIIDLKVREREMNGERIWKQ